MTAKITVKASAKNSKINLYDANTQWAQRPADQRFWTLAEMTAFCQKVDSSRHAEMIPVSALSVDADMRLVAGKSAAPCTNWAFGQLCARADVPAHFLRTLPPSLASQVLNHGLRDRIGPKDQAKEVRVCYRGDVGAVETLTSSKFAYIPSWKILEGLAILEKKGWRVPPARPSANDPRARAATKADVVPGSRVKEGEMIAPAGLYASDRDMFAFMIHEEPAVDDGTGHNPLRRGVFVSQSEVGAASFRLTTFLFDDVCGNHIVWGAHDVLQATVRHLGDTAPARAFAAVERDLDSSWSKKDAESVSRTIRAARKMILGEDAETVVERLVNEKRLYVGKADALAAYRLAEELDADRVDPKSVWGMVTGFTRLSQQEPHQDRRLALDTVGAGLIRLVDPEAKCGYLRRGARTVEAETVK